MNLIESPKYYPVMSNKFLQFTLLLFFIGKIAVAQEKPDKDTLQTDRTSLQLQTKQLADKDRSKSQAKSDTVVLLEDADIFDLSDDTIVAENSKKQIDTTSYTRKKGNPVVATLCSTLVPGLGQAYNKKYWKIPIIYTIFGSMYFFARNNHQKYKDFKFAYKHFENKELKPIWVKENVKVDYLKKKMEFYKRNRNFNIIVGGIFYLLNILDANVDAHLMDFDVGDDLSLRIEPDMNYNMYTNNSKIPNFGLKFVFAINK